MAPEMGGLGARGGGGLSHMTNQLLEEAGLELVELAQGFRWKEGVGGSFVHLCVCPFACFHFWPATSRGQVCAALEGTIGAR